MWRLALCLCLSSCVTVGQPVVIMDKVHAKQVKQCVDEVQSLDPRLDPQGDAKRFQDYSSAQLYEQCDKNIRSKKALWRNIVWTVVLGAAYTILH